MPELPEVETVRRALAAALSGAEVIAASLHRRDILRPADRGVDPSEALLAGATLARFHRRGKQLVMEAADGRALLVHLGMSGRLLLHRSGRPAPSLPHTHAHWTIRGPTGAYRLEFVDPRRFGWLRALRSTDLAAAWEALGPDALELSAADLAEAMHRSRRAIKALLLDQSMIAGVGNIYADEALHRLGLHPSLRCDALVDRAGRIATALRAVLRSAVELGGSTVRDYRDPAGDFGSFQLRHRVYGRHGEPCRTCARHGRRTLIRRMVVAGRGTWFCPVCQPAPRRPSGGSKALSTRREHRG